MRNWLRNFWFHDTIDEMQRAMLRNMPRRLQTHDYWHMIDRIDRFGIRG